jgi:uncharacterized protein DUF5670
LPHRFTQAAAPKLQAGRSLPDRKLRRGIVLETIIVILVILWLLGVVTSYTMGGFIHILLVLALIVIVIRVLQGRRL